MRRRVFAPALMVANGAPGPYVHDAPVSVAWSRIACSGGRARPWSIWRSAIVSNTSATPSPANSRVDGPEETERVLGVPAVDDGLVTPPPLPEPHGVRGPERPGRRGRIPVQ